MDRFKLEIEQQLQFVRQENAKLRNKLIPLGRRIDEAEPETEPAAFVFPQNWSLVPAAMVPAAIG